MADKILNQSQAIAVRDAMCALNNVSARADEITMQDKSGNFIKVSEDWHEMGRITITLNTGGVIRDGHTERHANQNAFFAAYGIE